MTRIKRLYTEELESVHGEPEALRSRLLAGEELLNANAEAKICFICADGTMDNMGRVEHEHKLQEHRSLSSAVQQPAVDEHTLMLACSGCGASVSGACCNFPCPNCGAQPRITMFLRKL